MFKSTCFDTNPVPYPHWHLFHKIRVINVKCKQKTSNVAHSWYLPTVPGYLQVLSITMMLLKSENLVSLLVPAPDSCRAGCPHVLCAFHPTSCPGPLQRWPKHPQGFLPSLLPAQSLLSSPVHLVRRRYLTAETKKQLMVK